MQHPRNEQSIGAGDCLGRGVNRRQNRSRGGGIARGQQLAAEGGAGWRKARVAAQHVVKQAARGCRVTVLGERRRQHRVPEHVGLEPRARTLQHGAGPGGIAGTQQRKAVEGGRLRQETVVNTTEAGGSRLKPKPSSG